MKLPPIFWKRLILISTEIIVVALVGTVAFEPAVDAFKSYRLKISLNRASEKYDPSALELEKSFNDYIQSVRLPDSTNTGIIKMKDGSSSKFWFKSHHSADDGLGGTWFAMSDGSKTYMTGWFCCEVQLEKQLASLNELRQFIREHDGISP